MNRKFAVCAGINDYPGTGNDLGGCVNDAHDWADLLTDQGYRTELLVDSLATHATVTTELKRAVADARWGDRIVFTYSGHGTWVPDRSGDEADGRDEAMCLYDFQSGGLLLDDEVQSIFEKTRRGVSVLILSDSCFSGTVSRFVSMTGSAVSTIKPRFIPPHTFIDGLTESKAVALEENVSGTPRPTTSLISGCDDTQYSYDAQFGTRPNGAFTRVAIDTWHMSGGRSLGAWYARIRKQLPSDDYPQSPQLTATTYRKRVKAL